MTTRRHLLASGASWLAPGAAWAATPPAPEGPLRLVNTAYPPLVNPQGHPAGEGLDIDIAREALRRGGYTGTVELQWVPWKRVLFMLERGLADFTTTVNHSPERDRFLAWSHSYRAGKDYHFYTRRGAGLRLGSLQDLRGLRLAISEGYLYPRAVLDAAEGRTERARDVGAAVELVTLDRADVVVVTALVGQWELHRLSLQTRVERQPLQYFNPEPTYMGFSRASERGLAALPAMNAGLDRMLRDGSLPRLERRYVK